MGSSRPHFTFRRRQVTQESARRRLFLPSFCGSSEDLDNPPPTKTPDESVDSHSPIGILIGAVSWLSAACFLESSAEGGLTTVRTLGNLDFHSKLDSCVTIDGKLELLPSSCFYVDTTERHQKAHVGEVGVVRPKLRPTTTRGTSSVRDTRFAVITYIPFHVLLSSQLATFLS